MYEAPIEVYRMVNDIIKQQNKAIENEVWSSILKVGVNVDKEELIKALRYDREQYQKGYKDGFKDGIIKFAERLKLSMFGYYDCLEASAKGRPYKGDTLMDYEVVDMIEDCIDNLAKEMTDSVNYESSKTDR